MMKRKFEKFQPYQYNYNHLITAYDVGIEGPVLGQTQHVTGLKLLTVSQPQSSDNLMSY